MRSIWPHSNRPQEDPTVDSLLPWGELNVENDVAVLMEKQNFLQGSWGKMGTFPVCLGCRFQNFRRRTPSFRQAGIPFQCSGADLTKCGGLSFFVNKKTSVADADPLLLEHQKRWANKLAHRKSATAEKLGSRDCSNGLHLSTAKRLFNRVTLQPCVLMVGAALIVFVKMSCRFSDLGCSHNKEAVKLSVWNGGNCRISFGAKPCNSFPLYKP